MSSRGLTTPSFRAAVTSIEEYTQLNNISQFRAPMGLVCFSVRSVIVMQQINRLCHKASTSQSLDPTRRHATPRHALRVDLLPHQCPPRDKHIWMALADPYHPNIIKVREMVQWSWALQSTIFIWWWTTAITTCGIAWIRANSHFFFHSGGKTANVNVTTCKRRRPHAPALVHPPRSQDLEPALYQSRFRCAHCGVRFRYGQAVRQSHRSVHPRGGYLVVTFNKKVN